MQENELSRHGGHASMRKGSSLRSAGNDTAVFSYSQKKRREHMHSVRCEFIRESSRLSVKFVLQGELVLSSFLLSAIINELKGIMDESARELLRQILGALDDLWLNEKEKGFEVCRFSPRTLITILYVALYETSLLNYLPARFYNVLKKSQLMP
jgi:hypothetical protein